MTLDVETPEPPTLRGPQDPGDYDAVDEPDERTGDSTRRENLADFLEAGAWEDAFDEWAADTYMNESEFRAVRELGLLEELDFYWNPSAEDVGYRVPTVPEDLTTQYDDIDEGEVEDVQDELAELGRTVSEVLENDYIHRDGEEFGYSWE
ncbi:hypothetical protein [Natrinema sp. 1APR25-10V2]|uniref:hypothetical protein n=1 Tax=Natrinema sp. 1APR25-10V2 TaxID=2951081 RepID=UPI002875B811|nr:hypothetical protein [Natrinema sp. 1APR25-10V2]MDS0474271.1 hypothetical protein [Natrinema sp. 1APR25-10V2]